MTDNEAQPPPLRGIHHLKLPVSDLDTSLTFYQRAFGARRIPDAAWDQYLTGHGIVHSEVITAIQAWLIVVPDPDGHRLRLYTLETHGPELTPDEGNPWVRST